MDTEYNPAPNDPTQTIQAVYEITDTVIETQIAAPNYIARVQRKVRQVSADSAWSDQNYSPPASGDIIYTLQTNQVTSKNLNNAVILEFEFPLAVGAQWCPALLTRPSSDPAIPTDVPCAYGIGMRIVRSAGPYQSPAGTYPTCFLLDDVSNGGDVYQTFCEGVGIVEQKYDHGGTRFGFSRVLTGFIAGTAALPTPGPSSQEQVNLPIQTPFLIIGKGSPTSLAVSPNGQWMAVSTQLGVYMYYATQLGKPWWFTPLPEKAALVVFNPQSGRLGVATGSGVVILDVVNGKVLVTLEGAGSSFAWSPDGQRLVSGSGCEQVTVWDAADGAALKELRGGKCSEGYSGIKVTWAAEGRIYGASMGAKILAWDGDTYAPLEGFSAEGAKDTWVSAIFAAPQGDLLAQYDSMGYPIVAIIDGKQNRQLHLLDQQVNGPITTLAWAQDGQHLAVAYGMNTGLILIWNAQTGQVEQKIEGFYTAVGLGWSADGSTLFGPQPADGKIDAIAVSTGQVVSSISGHAPVGNFLTYSMENGIVTTNGVSVMRWTPLSPEPLQQETVGSPQEWVVSWPPAGPGPYLFASSDRGPQVGSGSSKKPLAGAANQYPFPTAWSWDGSRLADPAHVWDAGTGKLLAQLQDPTQQHNPDQVAWSPDGKRLASADSLNMQPPVIWDSQTGKVLLTLKSETGGLKPLWLGLAWSPDGKKLAAVGSLMHEGSGEDEGMILLWDAETGQQVQLLTAGMHAYRLLALAWSPNSQFLACGTTGHALFVWDMGKGIPLARLEGHRDVIDRLAWAPDGHELASVARDGTLQIWRLSQFWDFQ